MNLRTRRLVLGGIFFALMFFYHSTTLYFQLVPMGSYTGWRGESADGKHFYTTTPDPESPTALTQRGDELIAINGIHPADDMSLLEFADRAPVGTPFTMTFVRDGQPFTIIGRTVSFPTGKYTYASRSRLTITLIWFFFLLTGLTLLLLKPENHQAWLLSLMLGSFTGVMTDTYPFTVFGFAFECLIALPRIAAIWFFPLFALFFLNFPERSRLLLKLPQLPRWIYWSNYFLVLPLWLAGRLPTTWRADYIKLPVLRALFEWDATYRFSMLVIAIYLIAGFYFIGYNYWHSSLDARRRARVAILGSSPGFIALLLFVLDNFASVRNLVFWATVMFWVRWLLYYVLSLIPLSFAYAIIRHKVVPISFIIRQGLRYLLVKRGAMLVIIAVVWILVTRSLTSLFEYWRPSGLMIGLISAVVGIAAWKLSEYLNERFLAPMIDRRFFRSSYDAQQIMSELSESLRTVSSQPQLLELVSTHIQAALQTHTVSIFLLDSESSQLICAHRCEYDLVNKNAVINKEILELSNIPPLLQQAADNETVLDIEELVFALSRDSQPKLQEDVVFTSDKSSSSGLQTQNPPSLSSREIQILMELKAALLFPLKTKDKLHGFIVVGAKLGDMPFTAEDKRLLANVGAPTSLALENARLLEQRIEDARRREELETQNEARRRELEEARQLQLSMLPKEVPKLPQLEIAAYMKTATEVGGDYYDFALAKDGSLTIAIGDATGHGLKAGTVVTATKSLFNAHAHDPSISETFSLISRALKQMNMRSMFMALTLVRIENRWLRLSCAGMPPLFIYRAATGDVEEHLQKAVPLGSIKQYPYTEFSLELHSGDVLLLMSDGLPEHFNKARELLGYEPIKRVISDDGGSASPQLLIEKLLSLGEDWAMGIPQDDDVTLLVLKMR